MYVTRNTPVALLFSALVASVGGAQASGSKPAAAPAPSANPQQDSAVAAQFKKLGLLAYPAKGQSADKQTKDQTECYAWAKDQTGFDPMTAAAPNADSAAKAAQAGNATVAASNQQVDTFKKAVGTCMTGRGYTFSK